MPNAPLTHPTCQEVRTARSSGMLLGATWNVNRLLETSMQLLGTPWGCFGFTLIFCFECYSECRWIGWAILWGCVQVHGVFIRGAIYLECRWIAWRFNEMLLEFHEADWNLHGNFLGSAAGNVNRLLGIPLKFPRNSWGYLEVEWSFCVECYSECRWIALVSNVRFAKVFMEYSLSVLLGMSTDCSEFQWIFLGVHAVAWTFHRSFSCRAAWHVYWSFRVSFDSSANYYVAWTAMK